MKCFINDGITHVNKHESVVHKQEKKQSIETFFEEGQMKDLLDKDFSSTTNIFNN